VGWSQTLASLEQGAGELRGNGCRHTGGDCRFPALERLLLAGAAPAACESGGRPLKAAACDPNGCAWAAAGPRERRPGERNHIREGCLECLRALVTGPSGAATAARVIRAARGDGWGPEPAPMRTCRECGEVWTTHRVGARARAAPVLCRLPKWPRRVWTVSTRALGCARWS
jgi:hypothetical protein